MKHPPETLKRSMSNASHIELHEALANALSVVFGRAKHGTSFADTEGTRMFSNQARGLQLGHNMSGNVRQLTLHSPWSSIFVWLRKIGQCSSSQTAEQLKKSFVMILLDQAILFNPFSPRFHTKATKAKEGACQKSTPT